MKLTISRSDLADAVTIAGRALPDRPPAPVLAGLLLQAGDGALTVSGFDYETSITTTASAAIGEPGQALVSGRLLGDIVRSVRRDITLHTDAARLVLEAGSARFTLPLLPQDEYPTLPTSPSASGTVPTAALAAAVAKVGLAASHDDAVPILTGIQVAVMDGRLMLWATDRYRIAVQSLPWQGRGEAETGTPVIPAKQLLATAKSLGQTDPVALALPHRESLIGLTGGSLHATFSSLEGQLPAYDKLLPTEFAATVAVDSAALAEALKRVSLVADASTPVRLEFREGQLALHAGSGDEAQAADQIAADCDGEPMTIAFNARYLLDGLASIDAERTQFGFLTPTKPALIQSADAAPNEARYLIMPVRLSR